MIPRKSCWALAYVFKPPLGHGCRLMFREFGSLGVISFFSGCPASSSHYMLISFLLPYFMLEMDRLRDQCLAKHQSMPNQSLSSCYWSSDSHFLHIFKRSYRWASIKLRGQESQIPFLPCLFSGLWSTWRISKKRRFWSCKVS